MRERIASIACIACLVCTAVLTACGTGPYIELYIADDRLPFLEPNVDFDALVVSARAPDCADTEVRYPALPLPATLTVLPGDCFTGEVSVRAFALLGERRVAESSWLDMTFPSSGVLVRTATLTALPGPRVRFRTGFEPGEPIGGTDDMLFVVRQRDVDDLDARVDNNVAEQGSRSIQVRGIATSTSSHVIVRAAATDLVISPGDRLVYAMQIEPASRTLTVGVDLQLDTGLTAEMLGLEDLSGIPIHPASSAGRVVGSWQRFIVDLTPAAGARLVGILFGFDLRGGEGSLGELDAHLDDVLVEAP